MEEGKRSNGYAVMGEYHAIKRGAPRGRSVNLSTFLIDVIHKTSRINKKILRNIVDAAVEQVVKMLLEDGLDVTIDGLGRLESEILDGRELVLGKRNLVTEYPPGSSKLKFIPKQKVKAKARPRFMRKNCSKYEVLKWYEHLYNSDGTPKYDIDPALVFDSSLVAKLMTEEMDKMRRFRKNGDNKHDGSGNE